MHRVEITAKNAELANDLRMNGDVLLLQVMMDCV
jgi:hypothetical protein